MRPCELPLLSTTLFVIFLLSSVNEILCFVFNSNRKWAVKKVRLGRDSFAALSTGDLGPVHMIPGQRIAPGQLTDPGVNFASVHGLTPVTVHMSFSLPWGNFERQYNTG